MQVSQIDLIKFSVTELWRMKKLALILFVIVSLSILTIGWFWPRVYVSSSTVLVDDQNILTPLMEGTAIATSVKDHAKNAWQLLTGQFAKSGVESFIEDEISDLSEADIDRLWESIKYKTKISNVGKNLISITYKSSDPQESQKYAAFFTDMFINESVKDKRRESEAAYQFIASQAHEYHEKLKKSEESLKNFRSANLGASPDSAKTVSARILELQRTVEQTHLEITEIEIQLKNIEDQLSGEADVSAHLTEEGQIHKRISALQGQLDTLRMTYLDNYPDIVILNDQISSLKDKLEYVRKQDKKKVSLTGTLSPLLQQLKSHYSQNSTQLVALQIRLKATKNLLEDEKNRAIQINTVSAVLAQITRGYDVNKDLYQTLLRQRETARVSMNIDIANQGMTLKIQESANLPSRPVGLRFMHFAILGLMMGLLSPLVLMYLMVMFDGRVRSKSQFQSIIQAPVLGSVPSYKNAISIKNTYLWVAISCGVVMSVVVVYGYVIWLRVLS
jgi:polysaccharide chain length determinant protein (PEP-CTERM system associated)